MESNMGESDGGIPDQGYQLYITSLVMVLVAGLFVICRLVVRYIGRNPGFDDYVIIMSLVRFRLSPLR